MSVLTEPTLVLNKSWYPIDSMTVRDAFGDVMSGRATFLSTPEFVAHDIGSWMSLPVDDKYIQTATNRIRVPEIMLLTEYSKVPVRKVVFCRRNLFRRDNHCCQYCGIELSGDEATIDHIVPKFSGGLSTFANCVISCVKCNLKKGHRSLEEAGMRLRRTRKLSDGSLKVTYYDVPKHPVWNPLYALKRKHFPESWAGFLKDFDSALYWEVELLEK